MSLHADSVRNEQAKVLASIQPMDSEEVLHNTVRGQYGDGFCDGERLAGYRSEPGRFSRVED